MRYTKRIIGIIGAGLLIATASIPNRAITEEVEVVETINPKEIHYLTDEELSLLYTCKQDIRKTNPNIVEVSTEEADLLMRVGLVEGGEGDALGQAYVMQTIVNRTMDENFPDTITEVLFQDKQFATVTSGVYRKKEPNANSHYALYLLESGQVNSDALYFVADWVQNSWQASNKEYLFSYGGHDFYR